MAERDEPDSSPLGRDATVRHIRLIRAQLKRLSSNDPQGTVNPGRTPVEDRGQAVDAPGLASTSPASADPDPGSGAPSKATLDLIEAELAALRQRVALLETHLGQLRAAARHEEGEEPG
ncbi:MAG TPA: hypothetical protein VGE43_18635 [Acidimicrobiales bacterium]